MIGLCLASLTVARADDVTLRHVSHVDDRFPVLSSPWLDSHLLLTGGALVDVDSEERSLEERVPVDEGEDPLNLEFNRAPFSRLSTEVIPEEPSEAAGPNFPAEPPVVDSLVDRSTLANEAAFPAFSPPVPEETPGRQPRRWFRELFGIGEPVTSKMMRGTLGATTISGNANLATVDIRGEFERSTERTFRQLDLGGQRAETPTKITANRWFMNWNADRRFRESEWIVFTTSKNEYNGVANIDYRGTLSAGLGYWILQTDVKRFILRFGPGVTYEKFQQSVDDRVTPDVFGEAEIRWPVFRRTSIEQRLRLQPSVLDMELVRIFSNSSLVIDLDQEDRWKLRLGLRYEYVSIPAGGRVPTDMTSTISLSYLRK